VATANRASQMQSDRFSHMASGQRQDILERVKLYVEKALTDTYSLENLWYNEGKSKKRRSVHQAAKCQTAFRPVKNDFVASRKSWA
jgi:hypothetical protein